MSAALTSDVDVAARAAVEETKKPKNRKRTIVAAVVALAVTTTGGWAFAHRGLESTDDAQIDAELVALSPRVGGVVVKVLFEDNQTVKAGQVLAEIDPEPARAKLAQAEANLEAAKATAAAAETDARLAETNARANNRAASASMHAASAGAVASRDQIGEARARVTAAESALEQAKLDFDRVDKLVASGALSAAQRDQARTARDTAEAHLAQARASVSALESSAAQAQSRVSEASAKVEGTRDIDSVVAIAQARARGAQAQVAQLSAVRDLAKLELSYTTLVAPQDGVVSKKNVAVGQTLAAGSPVAQLLPAKPVWVTANFKETQVGRMHEGQPVEIAIDAFHGKTLHGHVESFSSSTGAKFALLPPDNATGNFTKVVQRVPVRVRFDIVPQDIALRPGMSADVTVDTRK
jgi:membrane fusion protein (multidrug efflux system)